MKKSDVNHSLSVIIFAYNEQLSIEDCVKSILKQIIDLNILDYEIIIINDGSFDGTTSIIKNLTKLSDRISLRVHKTNLGLGHVYKNGFYSANKEFITFYPADGQFPASNLTAFIGCMNDYDLILGYIPDRKSSLLSKILSVAERLIYDALFGKLPKFQGLFMVRRSALDKVVLKSDGRGWGIVMEMIIKIVRGGYRVKSVPTVMKPRLFGNSKVNNVKTIIANLKQLLELRGKL